MAVGGRPHEAVVYVAGSLSGFKFENPNAELPYELVRGNSFLFTPYSLEHLALPHGSIPELLKFCDPLNSVEVEELRELPGGSFRAIFVKRLLPPQDVPQITLEELCESRRWNQLQRGYLVIPQTLSPRGMQVYKEALQIAEDVVSDPRGDLMRVAREIYSFVIEAREPLGKPPPLDLLPLLEELRRRGRFEGNCSEQAAVITLLNRAVGIPAMVKTGLCRSLKTGEAGRHAWSEFATITKRGEVGWIHEDPALRVWGESSQYEYRYWIRLPFTSDILLKIELR